MAGDLVDLSADGSAGPRGDKAFAEIGYEAGLEIGGDFCHGIRLTLDAQFKATAGAGVEIARFLEAVIALEAGARVSAEIAAQVSPDLTDTFGVTVVAAAQARAFVRASLDLAVTLGEFIDDDRTLALERRLLDRLLERVVLRAGFQASAEIAASAHATAVCRLDMGRRNQRLPGLDIRFGGGAGFLFGKSCDFFFMMRLDDMPGYFRDIRDDILDAMSDEIHDPLVRVGLKLVTDVAIDTMDEDRSSTDAVSDHCAGFLRELTLDAAVSAYSLALSTLLVTLVDAVRTAADPVTIAALDALAEQARTTLDAEGALGLLGAITELAVREALPQAHELSELSTAAHAFWKMIEPDAPLFNDPMPPHVRGRMRQAGIQGDHLQTQAEAGLLLLGHSGMARLDRLVRLFPGGDLLMDILAAAEAAGVSLPMLLQMLSPTASVADREQLVTLSKTLLQNFIETRLEPPLESALQAAVARGEIPQELADAVMEIAVAGRRVFLPGVMDALSAPNPKGELELLSDHARQVLSRIFMRQSALLGASVAHRAAEDFANQMDRMISRIRSGDTDLTRRLADLFLSALSDMLPVDLTGRGSEAELANRLDSFAIRLFTAGRRTFAQRNQCRLRDLFRGRRSRSARVLQWHCARRGLDDRLSPCGPRRPCSSWFSRYLPARATPAPAISGVLPLRVNRVPRRHIMPAAETPEITAQKNDRVCRTIADAERRPRAAALVQPLLLTLMAQIAKTCLRRYAQSAIHSRPSRARASTWLTPLRPAAANCS